jgi:hypothetical protein
LVSLGIRDLSAQKCDRNAFLSRRLDGGRGWSSWLGGDGLEPAQLILQLRYPAAQSFEDLPNIRRQHNAIFAMMPAGVAAFDGILKFFTACLASTGT